MAAVLLQGLQLLRADPLGDLVAVGAPAVLDEIGDTVDEDRGLSAARACQQKQGPLGGQDRLLLLRIELGIIQGDGRSSGLTETQGLFMVEHSIKSFFSRFAVGTIVPQIPAARKYDFLPPLRPLR